MKAIQIDANQLNAIKDEVFARQVAKETPHATRSVFKDEVERLVFAHGEAPQILSEINEKGFAWIGWDDLKLYAHVETFLEDVANEVASEL